jgi:hypothetical protein
MLVCIFASNFSLTFFLRLDVIPFRARTGSCTFWRVSSFLYLSSYEDSGHFVLFDLWSLLSMPLNPAQRTRTSGISWPLILYSDMFRSDSQTEEEDNRNVLMIIGELLLITSLYFYHRRLCYNRVVICWTKWILNLFQDHYIKTKHILEEQERRNGSSKSDFTSQVIYKEKVCWDYSTRFYLIQYGKTLPRSSPSSTWASETGMSRPGIETSWASAVGGGHSRKELSRQFMNSYPDHLYMSSQHGSPCAWTHMNCTRM